MGKPVVHWEFWSKDPSKVSDFYSRVFDWKIQNIPEMMGAFSLFSDPDGRVLGIWKQTGR